MYQKIRTAWLSITLKQKLGIYTAMVILMMACSVAVTMKLMDFALGGFDEILNDNSRCNDFQEAMEQEVQSFESYIRERTEERREDYVLSCVRTERCLRSLPFAYDRIGEERYARTWNIRNGYETYSKTRELVAGMDEGTAGFITSLYQVYGMQSYLQDYARRLVQVTLKEGNGAYEQQVPVFYRMPLVIIAVSVVLMVAAVCLTRLLSDTLISPVIRLARSSRKIGQNDFSEEDMTVPNRDEMGELVRAFNKMKHSTEGYINTLKKNHEISELLHREEVERMEMEKRLDQAQLELLKSQINPHFLFNTLNMIGCMAKLEEASVTERMITSMSSLFRYNLKTSEAFVPLEQELKVVEDYIYIQKMRFGSRISYDSKIEVDAKRVIIPSFTLQPVVENAVIHGLSKKEQGGRIRLRVWQRKGHINISVADSGLGMDKEQLSRLKEALQQRRGGRVGIGLGNIYKRIHVLYENGAMKIYSRKGRGTVILMVIPLRSPQTAPEQRQDRGIQDEYR
ncbi:MAG: sensor histidine kinase [Eubacteriales bacterium]|nr:sensor histidine kinase [Eubacteriales bacterium]